jgi:hypothetical protein
MTDRSPGGLMQPLGTGELGGVGAAVLGAGAAEVVGAVGAVEVPGDPTPVLSASGEAGGAPTEQAATTIVATTNAMSQRFIEVDLEAHPGLGCESEPQTQAFSTIDEPPGFAVTYSSRGAGPSDGPTIKREQRPGRTGVIVRTPDSCTWPRRPCRCWHPAW